MAASASVRGSSLAQTYFGIAVLASTILGGSVVLGIIVRELVPFPRSAAWASIALVALVATASLVSRWDGPAGNWQIPATLARSGHLPYVSVFGLALGTAVITKSPSASIWLLVAWCTAAPTWLMGLLPLAVFGLIRGAASAALAVGGVLSAPTNVAPLYMKLSGSLNSKLRTIEMILAIAILSGAILMTVARG